MEKSNALEHNSFLLHVNSDYYGSFLQSWQLINGYSDIMSECHDISDKHSNRAISERERTIMKYFFLIECIILVLGIDFIANGFCNDIMWQRLLGSALIGFFVGINNARREN